MSNIARKTIKCPACTKKFYPVTGYKLMEPIRNSMYYTICPDCGSMVLMPPDATVALNDEQRKRQEEIMQATKKYCRTLLGDNVNLDEETYYFIARTNADFLACEGHNVKFPHVMTLDDDTVVLREYIVPYLNDDDDEYDNDDYGEDPMLAEYLDSQNTRDYIEDDLTKHVRTHGYPSNRSHRHDDK